MPNDNFRSDPSEGEIDYESDHLQVRRYQVANGALINGRGRTGERGNALTLYVGFGPRGLARPVVLVSLVQERGGKTRSVLREERPQRSLPPFELDNYDPEKLAGLISQPRAVSRALDPNHKEFFEAWLWNSQRRQRPS